MRSWLAPLALGLALAALGYWAAMAAIPRVLMTAAWQRVSQAGGVNVMRHAPLAGPASRAVVRPSPDLAYSSCAFDLSESPVLVSVAPSPSPYWSLSVFDARTDVGFVRNNRDTQGRPIRLVIAHEDQAVPAGVETVRLSGVRGIALIRILVEDRARFPAIDTARRRSDCRPIHPDGRPFSL
jgi:uncharacterized membrane protein